MPTALITGANRGLGLALARRAGEEGWRVVATCRDPAGADALSGLSGDIDIRRLDVADRGAIEALASELAGTRIDILINNAGVSGRGEFGSIDFDAWETAFRVNAIGPAKMAECFVDHVAAGERRLIVCLSSYMGSISAAGGGYYPYRSSKAALNMVVANLASDLGRRGITVVAVHPGWVRTDMGGRSAPLGADDSAAHLWRLFAEIDASDSGAFLNYDGDSLSW